MGKPRFHTRKLTSGATITTKTTYKPPRRSRRSSSCFPYLSPVLTPTGWRAIGDLKIDDLVLSFDINSSLIIPRPITHKLQYSDAEIWEIKTASQREVVHVTESHSVLCKRGWTKVSDITKGDIVVQVISGKICETADIHIEKTGRKEPVFNIYTSHEHTFIVGTLVVHNFSFLRSVRTLLHELFISKQGHNSLPKLVR